MPAKGGVRPPNVVLILTDDQGYGDLSCHGNPVLKTPEMDRLHAESVRLTDFHVAPMCTPTRGELMTGQDCLRNGASATCLGRHMPHPDLRTVAEMFSAGGYRTGMFGKWHLGNNYPYRPMDRGFDEALYHQGFGLTGADAYWCNDYFDPYYRHNGEVKRADGFCTDFWFEQAIQWMDDCRRSGAPFFCYLPTNAPHFPFWVDEKYREVYEPLDPAGFYGLIANIDENLGRLERFMRETGLRENTILIFMTDNGTCGNGSDKVWNGGMRGSKCSRYDGGHRVPCFIRWPGGGLEGGTDITYPAQAQDVMPTLADLCGLSLPAEAEPDGISLGGLLRDDVEPPSDRMFVVHYYQNSLEEWDAAVVWDRWRLVWGEELFDIRSDPGQENDVAAEHPDIVEQMRAHHEEWWAGVESTRNRFSPLFIGSEAQNPVRLTSCEWEDVRCDGAGSVRKGSSQDEGRGGPWNVEVARPGSYRIELCRWPHEANAALADPVPAFQSREGELPPGKARPIGKARLKVGDGETVEQPVGADDREATFTVPLEAGRTKLHAWFAAEGGQDLCGAYFAYVNRLD